MRITADEIRGGAPVVVAVTDGVDFVDVATHYYFLPCAIMHIAGAIAMIAKVLVGHFDAHTRQREVCSLSRRGVA